jgi:glycoside/pentoside/hexuronide:cation symporter, GPH family
LGWTLGGALTGWLLSYFGFKANEVQSDTAITGIKMMLSFLPAIGTVLSVIFISLYPLSEKKVKDITLQLEERRKDLK